MEPEHHARWVEEATSSIRGVHHVRPGRCLFSRSGPVPFRSVPQWLQVAGSVAVANVSGLLEPILFRIRHALSGLGKRMRRLLKASGIKTPSEHFNRETCSETCSELGRLPILIHTQVTTAVCQV